MKKDIVKELQSTLSKRKSNNEKNDVIQEVNKLLEYDQSQDVEILRMVGSQSSLVQSENERGALIELEKHEKFYSGTIFTSEQIEKVAVKYRLKFLPSSSFTAYLDPRVALDIKELERTIIQSMNEDQANRRNMTLENYLAEHGSVKFKLDAHELKTKFFILAPAKCFNLKKVEAFTIKSPDPILFYRVDYGHFRLIRKWGSDFTILRRLLGVFFFSRRSMCWSTVAIISAISLGLSFTFSFNWLLLLILNLLAIPMVYAVEWHHSFFGTRYPTSEHKY